MLSLPDLPVDLLLDNLLPLVPVPDLLRLGSTNRFFALLCADDTFWKRRLESEFNFSTGSTARTTGWKFIYRGLSKPRVFVWGNKENGRLGLTKLPKTTLHHVPFPIELRIPGARIVSLIAGGMSFHALDSEGRIYVWGTLDGTTNALPSDGFSDPAKMSKTPLRLDLPAPTRTVSCGRLHLTTLDSNSHIWTFLSWGRPFRLDTPLLNNTSPETSPLQVESGWGFSSVLTKAGDVFVWWPFGGEMNIRITNENDTMNRDGDKKAQASADGVIPCVAWRLGADPVRLPRLPTLPKLFSNNNDSGENINTHLVQIAGLDRHLIGLTNQGHVLKFGFLDNEVSALAGTWEYLPQFSEVEIVRQHPTFQPLTAAGDQDKLRVEPPTTMKITHISAAFLNFTAYSTGSSSIVIMGDTNTDATSTPKIIPALQNRSVISVVLGDYHCGALTSTGHLLTWGAYSKGALGLGDPAKIEPGMPGGYADEFQRASGRHTPPGVEVPTEVRFDHASKKRKDRFCFAATAAGWHMGALVIDLDPEDEDDEDVELPEEDDPQSQYPSGPGHNPIFPPGRGIFRVGFAGRGMHHRGGGSGSGSGLGGALRWVTRGRGGGGGNGGDGAQT